MKEKIGLVLEGGGFRGLYSEGILETFLENNIHLPYVIGVSMGSAIGACYISRQKRRNYDIAMTYIDDTRYLSYRNMLTQGSMFGMDFVFQDLAYELIPFDFETFSSSDQELAIGAMRCDSGEMDYFYKSKMSEEAMMTSMRASCSLPFISKMVAIEDTMYLDGGIADSIPYKKALEDGCDKVIVILTRDADYRRKPFVNHRLGSMFYREYPAVVASLENRHIRYHETLDGLLALEKEGKALIIRPSTPIVLGRMEKDRSKLRSTYMMGYNQGKEILDEVDAFVNGERKYQHQVQLSYQELTANQLDGIRELWEKLNEIHTRLSPNFSDMYRQVTFEKRCLKFYKHPEENLRIRVVKDGDDIVGYCITTVDEEAAAGDLESIYVKPSYRHLGIGESLIEDSKTWMMSKNCKRMTLGVSVGNEGVLDFYQKAGFYPRLIEMEYKQ